MSSITLLLAWRYLRGTSEEKNISIMAAICFIGIMIGACALALIVSIMQGIEIVTHEKMQTIHPQLYITTKNNNQLNLHQLEPVLKKEFPEIAAMSTSAIKQVIVQNKTKTDDDGTTVVLLKGIDPHNEAKTSDLERKLLTTTDNNKTLAQLLTNNRVIIGQKMAQELNVHVGDTLTILYADEEQQTRHDKVNLDETVAVVGATFNTGIDEFDNGLMICTLPFLNKLFPETGATHLSIRLHKDSDEQSTIEKLRSRLGLRVYSWKDLYPALVSALKLEKYAMFLILALITLVASMNIISLLFMLITQKRGDIAILRALGIGHRIIERVFLLIGLGISACAAIAGLILAFIFGTLLDRYPFITLPDCYYVTYLPVKMEFSMFCIIFLVIMILGFIATLAPARRTRGIHIANVLRFEA
jgi:lipoprotein-releasing system permease protein